MKKLLKKQCGRYQDFSDDIKMIYNTIHKVIIGLIVKKKKD